MRKLAAVAMLAVGLAGCGGDSTGPAYPDVEGRYAMVYRFSYSLVSGGALNSASCQGTLTISNQQDDGSFTGSFVVLATTPDCSLATGSLSGGVRVDGGISVLTAGETDYGLIGCFRTGGGGEYNGLWASRVITATRRVRLSCALPGVGTREVFLDEEIVATAT